MKIYIAFYFKDGPTGGGNQFLKALKNYFIKKEVYTDNYKDADFILFNSYQYISQVIKIKKQFPDKIFIHRIDGPISLYCDDEDKRDEVINYSNEIIADGTIFQTEWSKKNNYQLGLMPGGLSTVIINSLDQLLFNSSGKVSFSKNRKIRLIATSWSAQYKKGFQIYKWLDENLDFFKYDMTFIGRSPVSFSNIVHIPPLSSEKVAANLKQHDIYITASENDPCSNSLIEALSCGLPALAYRSGGHPEVIMNGGLLFDKKEEIFSKLEIICDNYKSIQSNILVPGIENVGGKYIDFMKKVQGESRPIKNIDQKMISKCNVLLKNIGENRSFAVKVKAKIKRLFDYAKK